MLINRIIYNYILTLFRDLIHNKKSYYLFLEDFLWVACVVLWIV